MGRFVKPFFCEIFVGSKAKNTEEQQNVHRCIFFFLEMIFLSVSNAFNSASARQLIAFRNWTDHKWSKITVHAFYVRQVSNIYCLVCNLCADRGSIQRNRVILR